MVKVKFFYPFQKSIVTLLFPTNVSNTDWKTRILLSTRKFPNTKKYGRRQTDKLPTHYQRVEFWFLRTQRNHARAYKGETLTFYLSIPREIGWSNSHRPLYLIVAENQRKCATTFTNTFHLISTGKRCPIIVSNLWHCLRQWTLCNHKIREGAILLSK